MRDKQFASCFVSEHRAQRPARAVSATADNRPDERVRFERRCPVQRTGARPHERSRPRRRSTLMLTASGFRRRELTGLGDPPKVPSETAPEQLDCLGNTEEAFSQAVRLRRWRPRCQWGLGWGPIATGKVKWTALSEGRPAPRSSRGHHRCGVRHARRPCDRPLVSCELRICDNAPINGREAQDARQDRSAPTPGFRPADGGLAVRRRGLWRRRRRRP